MKITIRPVHICVAAGLFVGLGTPSWVAQAEPNAAALVKTGDRHVQTGDLFEARASYRQALPLQSQLKAAQTLTKLADIHSELLEESQALEAALQAVELYEDAADPVGHAISLNQVGDAYADLDHNTAALQTLRQAHTLLVQAQSTPATRQGLADTLQDLGRVYRNLEQYPEAIQFFRQSLIHHQALNNSLEIGLLNGSIGGSYILLGERSQARPFFEAAHHALTQVLADSRRSGNQALEAKVIYHMGLNLLMEQRQGLTELEQALRLFRTLDYPVREADTLDTIGLHYRVQGQFDQQLEYAQQAHERFQATGDPIRVANSLGEIGGIQSLLGRYSQAVRLYKQAIDHYRELMQSPLQEHYPLQRKIIQTQAKLGEAQIKLGQYEDAIATLKAGLNPSAKAPEPTLPELKVAIHLRQQLGEAHSNLDQYPQALKHLNQALTLANKLNDPLVAMPIVISLVGVYTNLGQIDRVKSLLQQSSQLQRQAFEQIARKIGPQRNKSSNGESPSPKSAEQTFLELAQYTGSDALQAVALSTLGADYAKTGQSEQALETYQKALALFRELGDRPQESLILMDIGLLHLEQKQYSQAIQHFEQRLVLSRSLGNQADVGHTLNLMGQIYIRQARYAQAEQVLREAADLWDAPQPGLSDQDRVSQRDWIASTFHLLQQTLIAQNQPHTALEIAERGRARAFVELLTSRSSKVDGQRLSASALSIQQIQQVAQQQQATLVEYSILGQHLAIWVIPPTGDIKFTQVDLPKQSLKDLVVESRRDMGVRGRGTIAVQPNGERSPQALRQLYQLLIAPIAKFLPTSPEQRVVFIPQGPLFLVPFAALQDQQGAFLVQKHTVLSAPSIQVLMLTHQRQQQLPSGGLSLIVGNPVMPQIAGQQLPPLPGAEQEAIAIAQLLEAKAITGSQATERFITQQIPQAHLIHLATHGLLDDIPGANVPGAVALAPDGNGEITDGLLTAADIFEMRLNASLVVLSACDTGRGEITGDGVIGLSRSLIAAGTPSVVVSLWNVPDDSTALLMTEFYKRLQQNSDKAQALRQAMLTTQKTYSDPLHWAAFTLIGEAR